MRADDVLREHGIGLIKKHPLFDSELSVIPVSTHNRTGGWLTRDTRVEKGYGLFYKNHEIKIQKDYNNSMTTHITITNLLNGNNRFLSGSFGGEINFWYLDRFTDTLFFRGTRYTVIKSLILDLSGDTPQAVYGDDMTGINTSSQILDIVDNTLIEVYDRYLYKYDMVTKQRVSSLSLPTQAVSSNYYYVDFKISNNAGLLEVVYRYNDSFRTVTISLDSWEVVSSSPYFTITGAAGLPLYYGKKYIYLIRDYYTLYAYSQQTGELVYSQDLRLKARLAFATRLKDYNTSKLLLGGSNIDSYPQHYYLSLFDEDSGQVECIPNSAEDVSSITSTGQKFIGNQNVDNKYLEFFASFQGINERSTHMILYPK